MPSTVTTLTVTVDLPATTPGEGDERRYQGAENALRQAARRVASGHGPDLYGTAPEFSDLRDSHRAVVGRMRTSHGPVDRELPELADALERAERAGQDAERAELVDSLTTDHVLALQDALSEALAVLRRDGYVIPPTLGG